MGLDDFVNAICGESARYAWGEGAPAAGLGWCNVPAIRIGESVMESLIVLLVLVVLAVPVLLVVALVQLSSVRGR
ncbi:hypothetical protein CATMIT_01561, partial [Catenibacterium mitsuokai DSM 15897]